MDRRWDDPDAPGRAGDLPVAPSLLPVPRPHGGFGERTIRLVLGAGTRAGDLVDRATGGAGRLPVVVDVVVGGLAVAGDGAARLGRVLGPLGHAAAFPPLVPRRWAPGTAVAVLAARGRAERVTAEQGLDDAVTSALPALVPVVLDRVLDQVDLTGVVLQRVDVAQVVAQALDSMDLTATVLERVDLGRVIDAALDELDLTALVLERVDLAKVVDEALTALDLTEVVMTEVDLVRVAEYVVTAIDLPEIIRESSGGIATEAVRGVRMQGIDADERVQRVIDRLIRRRHDRASEAVDLSQEEDA